MSNLILASWTLPAYVAADGSQLPTTLRFSAKARRWSLRLSNQGQLEVVVPVREAHQLLGKKTIAAGLAQPGPDSLSLATPPAQVSRFITDQQDWLERALHKTASQRQAYQDSLAAGLPKQLEFPLATELWQLEYQQTAAKDRVTVRRAGLRRIEGADQLFALQISGDVANEALCQKALSRWLTWRAKQVIPPFAARICQEIGARPASIGVNNRKTAWGICTAKGDIRIDRRVLFLPVRLARQVVLHEAAHLKHHNHSANFYAELYSYPDSDKATEKAVKQAGSYIPAWFG